jgi:hypothetical protein
MFYPNRAGLPQLRCGVRACCRNRWSTMRSPRSHAVPRVSTVPAPRAATKAGRAPTEVARLCFVWAPVPCEARHRWKNALSLSAQFLSRVLALRRAQHVKASARPQIVRGNDASASRSATRAVSSIAAEAASKTKA